MFRIIRLNVFVKGFECSNTFASYRIHRIILGLIITTVIKLIITAIIFKLIITSHEIHAFVLSVCMSTISSGFRRSWSSGWDFRIVTYANNKHVLGRITRNTTVAWWRNASLVFFVIIVWEMHAAYLAWPHLLLATSLGSFAYDLRDILDAIQLRATRNTICRKKLQRFARKLIEDVIFPWRKKHRVKCFDR